MCSLALSQLAASELVIVLLGIQNIPFALWHLSFWSEKLIAKLVALLPQTYQSIIVSLVPDRDYFYCEDDHRVVPNMKISLSSSLLLPGIGIIDDSDIDSFLA